MIGPTESLEEMCGALSRELLAMFERMRTDFHDAEDAVQDALVEWLMRLANETAEEVKNPLAWVRKVANRATWRSCQQRLPSNLVAVMSFATSFPDEAERRDEADIVQSALAMLPELERKLVEFCDIEERSLREAKEQFGISLHEVRSTLTKARAWLHQQLLARGLGRVIA